jgi:uncharacterized sulfatase
MKKNARLLPLLFCALAAATAGPPNIVMIVSDDHGWTDYSFMGHAQVRTPHLDRLASQSLTFRHGYVPSSLCCPSLAAMITGLYPHQSKIACNDPPFPPDAKGKAKAKSAQHPAWKAARKEMIAFMEKVPTLPRALGEKGYLSFQTGKWWQGHFKTGGFTHGMSHGDPAKGGRHGDQGLDIGRQTMQPIFDFIETARRENKPFFVWYAPMLPHQPHNPPDRLFAKYKDKTPSPHVARYWAMVEWFDETCGQLLDHLDQKNLAQETVVVYVTDNGWIQLPDSPRSSPKSKLSPYDGGLRTPIMIRWPGRVKPRMQDRPVLSIDIVPTLFAAVGLKPTADMQGINLLDEEAVEKRKAVFGECFTHNAVDIQKPATSLCWRWVIEDNWKLIVPAPQNKPDEKTELYDLAKDPHEDKNLADAEPRRVERLRALINEWWPARP